jgi:hypothetical protein
MVIVLMKLFSQRCLKILCAAGVVTLVFLAHRQKIRRDLLFKKIIV